MVFGGASRWQWTIYGYPIERVRSFKYLGIVFEEGGRWRLMSAQTVAKARRGWCALLSAGVGGQGLGSDSSCRLWKAIILPVLTYGAEVWWPARSDMSRLDRVLNFGARSCLGLPARAASAAARGDLGWLHADEWLAIRRLDFAGKLALLPPHRLSGRVATVARNVDSEWHRETRRLLVRFGLQLPQLQHPQRYREEYKAWRQRVHSAVWMEASKRWWEEVLRLPKLRIYAAVKECRLRTERYVRWAGRRAPVLARLRAGCYPLAVETGRWAHVPLWERVCPLCSAATEDEWHVLAVCPNLADERKAAWAELFRSLRAKTDDSTLLRSIATLPPMDAFRLLLGLPPPLAARGSEDLSPILVRWAGDTVVSVLRLRMGVMCG